MSLVDLHLQYDSIRWPVFPERLMQQVLAAGIRTFAICDHDRFLADDRAASVAHLGASPAEVVALNRQGLGGVASLAPWPAPP